jgi:PAS domain S-box-containing protein
MVQSESIRILYIEDDSGLARLVQKRLQRAGYVVDIASDGEEGIKKYEADSYDLLFVDQSLPVHDGLEVIRILGSNGSLPPTVMITGTGDERVAVEAMKLGAGDYIVKDVQGGYLELLPSVVEKVLQQRRAAEERQQAQEAYRAVVEHSLQGLQIIQEGRKVFVNSAYAEMVGYTEEELLALSPDQTLDLVHPDDRELVGKYYWARIAGKPAPQSYEFRIIRKGGSVRWVEIFASRIEYQGRPASQLAMIDITERKQAENALRQSEEHYRTLVDNINLGINLIDVDHTIVMSNAAKAKHFKRSVSDLIGKKCFREFEKRDTVCPHCPGVQAMATGRPAETEAEVVGNDGSPYHVRIQAFPFFGNDSSVTGFIEIAENITGRKQAEEALRIKDNAIRSSITAIAIAEFGGNVTYVNPEFLRLWGYKDEREVLGKPAVKFWHRDKKAGKIIRTMRKEQKVVGELKAKRKDGSLFDIQVSASTVADENDKPVWMMASCIDITERKLTDEALRESEERYRTLVENIDFGINLIDADHTIVMVNNALSRRLNKKVSDFVGEKCYRAFEKRDAVCPHCPGVRAMATGQPAEVETEGVEDDQDLFPARLQAFPIPQKGGTASGFIEVVEDISERKEVEQALMEHKKALQHSFFGTAEALSKVIEDRDPYTSGHSAGVAGLTEAMARLMGFPEDELTGIYIAGVLHDIGKMAVPVEILVKPGRLTDMEMSLIQIHPQAGYEILKGIDFPWPVAQATLQHHERMDGSGYPQKLKGDKIILEARILAVADVVDAMTHHRPYRPAFSVQDAMEEISKGRGRFYDRQVVDACLEVLEGKEAFTSSVYSMSSTSPQPRRDSTKPSALPATTMIRSSGRR